MEIVERKPVPVYETECFECHSKMRYKRSEVSLGYITCPVCGISVLADTIRPVEMIDTSPKEEAECSK